jgi:heptosyltransferase-2
LREIRKQSRECKIDFLVKKEFVQAIEFNPYLNDVLLYEAENTSSLRESIRQVNYDYILDLQNNLRSRWLLKGIRTQVYRFRKPTLKKLLLVHFKFNLLKEKLSIAQRYIDSFPLIRAGELKLDFYYPKEKDIEADSKIPKNVSNKNIIGICPGSKHFTKRYPSELFSKLIDKLSQMNYSVFLFGGKDDEAICSQLARENTRVINLHNDNDLYLTAALMKKCSAVISNDSALMHLSCSLDIPTVAIFGSTVAEFGFFPLNKKSVIIENKDLNCRPCTHIGRKDCPKKHFKCMKDISHEMITSQLQLLIKNE